MYVASFDCDKTICTCKTILTIYWETQIELDEDRSRTEKEERTLQGQNDNQKDSLRKNENWNGKNLIKRKETSENTENYLDLMKRYTNTTNFEKVGDRTLFDKTMLMKRRDSMRLQL